MKNIILVLILLNFSAFADEFSEFSDEKEGAKSSVFDVSGFFEVEQGINLTSTGTHREGTEDLSYVLANRRFRIDAVKNTDKGSLFTKIDFIRDEVIEEERIDIRELRFQYRLNDTFDLSIGRQVSTWGVSDMLFINDLFPKNWIANFTGRDMEMLKDPSDTLRLTSYFNKITVDTVYNPKFSPDTTPTGCRFSIYDPNTSGLISNKDSCSTDPELSSNDSDNGEIAIQIKARLKQFQLSLYGYHGQYKGPKGIKLVSGSLVGYYPNLAVYGASLEGQFGPGIFSFETGYYESKDDLSGDDFFIINSRLKYLFGYRMDFTSHFSAGAQIYQEKMSNYSEYETSFKANNPTGYDYREEEVSSTFTIRLNYKAMQDTLNYSLFTYIRPQAHDSFTKLEVTKKIDNNLSIATGLNIFEGSKNYLSSEFGMLKDDDNFYLRGRYSF